MEKIKEKNVWIPIYLSIYIYIYIYILKKGKKIVWQQRKLKIIRERESAKEWVFGGWKTHLTQL